MSNTTQQNDACENTITITGPSIDVWSICSHILDRHSQVDFAVLVTPPKGVYNALTYHNTEEGRKITFNTQNPERVGRLIVSDIVSVPMMARTPLLQSVGGVLNSECLNPTLSIEDNVKQLYDRQKGEVRAQDEKTHHVMTSLASLIIRDHATWSVKEFGEKCWQDWHVTNWGCLWNPEDCNITHVGDVMNFTVTISFVTPSTPPAAWFSALITATRHIRAEVSMFSEYNSGVSNSKGIHFKPSGDIVIVPNTNEAV